MDIVTHAVSGLLVSQVLPRKPRTAWFPFFCVLAACLPDIDILFASTPSLFLNLHRGISHSLALVPFTALFLALIAWPLRRKATMHRLEIKTLWLCFASCLLIHIALDCFTTYGTMIFLPFSSYRVRLNANFIVDLFLTIPLIVLFVCALVRKSYARILAMAGIAWLFLYPCTNIGLNALAGKHFADTLKAEGREVVRMEILPDFFSPLFWRAIYVEKGPDGKLVQQEQSISGLGNARGAALSYTPVPINLQAHLAAQSGYCRDFLGLMLLPVYRPFSERGRQAAIVALSFLPPDEEHQTGASDRGSHNLHPLDPHTAGTLNYLLVHDLRFGSGLAIGRKLLSLRPNAQLPFILLVVLDHEDNLMLERLIFSDARLDTGWQAPNPPEPQSFGRWLLGLD